MAVKLPPGEVTVHLHFGKGLKNCDWFGQQDPYVKIRCGSAQYRSNIHYGGGKHPVWNQVFVFQVNQETHLDVEVWDQDDGKPDDCVGKGTADLVAVRHAPNTTVNVEVPLFRPLSKRQHGHLHLTLAFLPGGAAASAAASLQERAASVASAGAPAYLQAAQSAASTPQASALSHLGSAATAGAAASPASSGPPGSLPAGLVPAGSMPDNVPWYEPTCGLIEPQPHQLLPCHQSARVSSSPGMQPAATVTAEPPPPPPHSQPAQQWYQADHSSGSNSSFGGATAPPLPVQAYPYPPDPSQQPLAPPHPAGPHTQAAAPPQSYPPAHQPPPPPGMQVGWEGYGGYPPPALAPPPPQAYGLYGGQHPGYAVQPPAGYPAAAAGYPAAQPYQGGSQHYGQPAPPVQHAGYGYPGYPPY